jgi:hypothetical protein
MLISMFMDGLPTLRFLEAIMQIFCEWSVDRSPQLRDIEKNQLTDNPISKPSKNSSTKGETTAKPVEKASAETASTSKRQKEKDAEDYEPIQPKKRVTRR